MKDPSRGIIIALGVGLLVFFALEGLDRYDEHLAEREAAAALEPNLGWPSLSHNPPSPAQWESPSPTFATKPPLTKTPLSVADFGPGNGAVGSTRTGDLTALFLYSPGEHRDVLSNDFRWVYVNLRDGGSIKLDREKGEAWLCPNSIEVLGPDPDRWCRSREGNVTLVPWQMTPRPPYDSK